MTASHVRLHRGLYRLVGVTHQTCGGTIQIEQCGSGEFRWESYCTTCQVCDTDGWPTLHAAAQAAFEAFTEHVS